MPTFQTYNVTPILPETLEPLRELSFNLWWTWEPAARRLFRELDPELWDQTNHNPVRMLQLSRQSRLEELAQDKNFLRELKKVFQDFEKYLGRQDTYGKTGPGAAIKNPIAYFSAEFGFHESIPNYSGGLGILAGDHCKSASDLDLNYVAIGLLYRHGYFRQQIDKDGIQAAINLNQNFYHLPIREARRGEVKLLISVPILDREVFARVWELRVGRVNVYLLDTDIPENSPEDRRITAELYGGDLEMRMRQEIILGIGGVKALTALGIQPLRNGSVPIGQESRLLSGVATGTPPVMPTSLDAQPVFQYGIPAAPPTTAYNYTPLVTELDVRLATGVDPTTIMADTSLFKRSTSGSINGYYPAAVDSYTVTTSVSNKQIQFVDGAP